MAPSSTSSPSPKRVAAGRRNRTKRKGLTEAGRQKLRDAALVNKPWSYATGPRTPDGKVSAAANGKHRQKGKYSVRELQAEVARIQDLIHELRDARMASLQPADSN